MFPWFLRGHRKRSQSRFAAYLFKKKVEVQQRIFETKLCTAIISGKLQGVVGGGENTFSAYDFIFLYIFYFIFYFIAQFSPSGLHSGFTAITSTQNERRKISKSKSPIIQGKVQGVVGGGKTHFPHMIFLNFFYFSPIFESTAWTTLLKFRSKKRETWKATSLQTSSPPYLLSISIKWGFFCENGDHVNGRQMKKNLLCPQGLFRQEKSLHP